MLWIITDNSGAVYSEKGGITIFLKYADLSCDSKRRYCENKSIEKRQINITEGKVLLNIRHSK